MSHSSIPNYNIWSFHNLTEHSVQQIMQHHGVPETVIEVGVFHGHFTFSMTHMIAPVRKNYRHFAIDPYSYSQELAQQDIQQAEQVFQQNLALCPLRHHIEFMHMTSQQGLLKLIQQGVQADFIYIDGDHRAPVVLQDLVLSWMLLKPQGVILCDDAHDWVYTTPHGEKPLQYSPRLAIDAFVHCHWHEIQHVKLTNSCQTAFVKLA